LYGRNCFNSHSHFSVLDDNIQEIIAVKLEDLSRGFEVLVDAGIAWAKCVGAPIVTGQTILAEAKNDTDAITQAAKIFITSFVLGSVLPGGIYQLYGIGFINFTFYLYSAAFLFTTFVACAFAIYIGFKAYKISTSFRDTFVFYTVSMSLFYPVVALLSLFELAQRLSILKAIKATNPDFWSAALQLVIRGAHPNALLGAAVPITGAVVGIFGSWQIAIVFCTLSRRWGVDRARIFDAGCFGLTVLGLLPGFLLHLINTITLYSFL
jgi:hypothetical protein